MVLVEVAEVVGNGNGAGSGQSVSKLKDLAVGTIRRELCEELRIRFDIGKRALAKKSLGLFVR